MENSPASAALSTPAPSPPSPPAFDKYIEHLLRLTAYLCCPVWAATCLITVPAGAIYGCRQICLTINQAQEQAKSEGKNVGPLGHGTRAYSAEAERVGVSAYGATKITLPVQHFYLWPGLYGCRTTNRSKRQRKLTHTHKSLPGCTWKKKRKKLA